MYGSKATGADIQVMTLPSPLPVGLFDLQGGVRGGSAEINGRNLVGQSLDKLWCADEGDE